MALHPEFPTSPYEPLVPEQRWFPADEALRATSFEKLVAPLVAQIRQEVFNWRSMGYASASPTTKALLNWWFAREHLVEDASGRFSAFRYYFAQREAVETAIWLHEVRKARDKSARRCVKLFSCIPKPPFENSSQTPSFVKTYRLLEVVR